MATFLIRHKGELGVEWAFIKAKSPGALTTAFRDIEIVEPWPEWATPQMVKDVGVYEIKGELSPLLQRLKREA